MRRLRSKTTTRLLRGTLPFVVGLTLLGVSTRAEPDFSDVLPGLVRDQQPALLDLEELRALSRNPHPSGRIRDKYEELWAFPTISNEAFLDGSRPHVPSTPPLGEVLRLASWNIEWSLHVDEAIEAFTDPVAYARRLDAQKAPPGSRKRRRALEERVLLATADVVVLREMDVGMQPSGDRDAARDLGGIRSGFRP